jgi:glycyl-tRNA synthetase
MQTFRIAKKRLGQIALPIRVDDPFSVFLPKGKPPESARKVAVQYYQQRGLGNPTLTGERTEKVENTTRSNPETGSLLPEQRAFNLMFKTYVGATEDESSSPISVGNSPGDLCSIQNILEVSRKKLPVGIAQIGKSLPDRN